MKSGKAKQNGKKELRKAQTKAKAQNRHPPEINSPYQSQCNLSPLDSHLSYFFSQPPD
jgi:hypothetical protein